MVKLYHGVPLEKTLSPWYSIDAMAIPYMRQLNEGPVNAQILRLSVPTMVGMLLQAVYDLVDMVWIGFISPAAIAAATLFSTLFWLVEVLNEIVGTSSVALISQSYGSGDLERTSRIAQQTLTFKFLVALVGAAFLAITLDPLLRFFTNDAQVVAYGMEYGLIRVVFLPLFFSSYSVNTIFRCTGDAKTPMRLLAGTALLNMIADPLFMFSTIPGTSIPGFGLGMRGAAIATVLSITVAFVVGFILLLKGKASVTIRISQLFRLELTIMAKLFTIGLPSGITLLLRNLSITIFLKMVALYGTGAIAVAGVAFRIYSFGMMPGWGLMMGSGIVIGHSLGSRDLDRARDAVRISTLDCLIFVGVIAVAILAFPNKLLALFMGGSSVPSEGTSLMYVVGIALFVGAAMSGMGAAFTGAGMNRPLLWASLFGQWGVLVPWALVVGLLIEVPIVWLWVALLGGDVAELWFRRHLYMKTNWISHRV